MQLKKKTKKIKTEAKSFQLQQKSGHTSTESKKNSIYDRYSGYEKYISTLNHGLFFSQN